MTVPDLCYCCQWHKEHTVLVPLDLPPRRLHRQPRLADAARPGPGQQPAIRICQVLRNLRQVRLAPHKGSEVCGQVVRRERTLGLQLLPVANALVQLGRLFRRFDVQLFGQETAAGLVLRQGCTAPATQRQQVHQLTQGFLLPGLKLYPTPSILTRSLKLAAPFMLASQPMKGHRRLASHEAMTAPGLDTSKETAPLNIQCGANLSSWLIGVVWMSTCVHVHFLCVYVIVTW